MKYNFDEIIERRNSNAMNTDGWRAYIFGAPDDAVFPYADDEYVRMWVADMEFAVCPEIIDAMQERLNKRIFGYTKIFDKEYYETFAAWCDKMYGWVPKKEHVFTSPGIIPALYELVEFLTEPDEKVLIMTPSYAFFMHAIDHSNRTMVCSDLINDRGNYSIDFEDFEAKAKDPKVKLCIFCNPHNPSGRVWTEEELKRVGQICKDNDVWLISDEIHCDLLRTGVRHTPMAKVMDWDKVITCMAPTKTFNIAGLQISHIMIQNPDLIKIWNDQHFTSENPLSIAASQAAYGKGGEWLAELKLYLDGNFKFLEDFLKENLPEAIYKIPDATYLAWVDVSAYLPGENLPMFFANNAGVLLEGGNMFVQNSDGYIRLNLAMQRSVLEEGMKRMAEAIKNRK